MIGIILIALVFVVMAAILVNPKIGSLLVWPILFLYPHLYLSRLALLPWNIGIDDLFICAFFVIVVIRCNFFDRIPLRIGVAGIGVTAYAVILAVANLNGWSMVTGVEPVEIVKDILKGAVVVMFTYCMLHTIDTERDLRRVVSAFVLTLTCAGITLILHKLYPQYFAIFSYGKAEVLSRYSGVTERPSGSLANPNVGSVLLGMTVFACICRARLEAVGYKKIIFLSCIPILLVAMVLAKSRSGLLSLGTVLLIMSLLGRHKRYGWLLLSGMAVMVVFKPGLFLDYWERIEEIYNPGVNQVGSGITSRIEGWAEYWRTATPQVWLFGQGFKVGVQRVGLHAHNTVISALFVHGIGGLVWFVLFIGTIITHTWRLVRYAPEPYRTIASGVGWGILIWLIGGAGLDMISQVSSRYVYFFYAVLVERSYALARQATQAEPGAYPSPSPAQA